MATTNSIAGSARFTLDGASDLEDMLSASCERILDRVLAIVPSSAFEGLILGGGYGRGEGGVLGTLAGDRPYNDLEFYLFISGSATLNSRRYAASLHHLAEEETERIGIEVEFKVLSIKQFCTAPTSIFYHDLAMGHKSLRSTSSLEPAFALHFDASLISISEATRLLMNRCSGLLFSRALLEAPAFAEGDADFVGRNLAKVQLGLGDAVLAARGAYHWSCLERRERLKALKLDAAWFPEIVHHHSTGVDFKLHPQKCKGGAAGFLDQFTALSALSEKIWLWVENQRLTTNFRTGREYAFSSHVKCPETNAVKNLLLNLRTFGIRAMTEASSLRYPRERLLNALPLLLWESDPASGDNLRFVQRQLHARATTFAGLVEAYRNVWRHYN